MCFRFQSDFFNFMSPSSALSDSSSSTNSSSVSSSSTTSSTLSSSISNSASSDSSSSTNSSSVSSSSTTSSTLSTSNTAEISNVDYLNTPSYIFTGPGKRYETKHAVFTAVKGLTVKRVNQVITPNSYITIKGWQRVREGNYLCALPTVYQPKEGGHREEKLLIWDPRNAAIRPVDISSFISVMPAEQQQQISEQEQQQISSAIDVYMAKQKYNRPKKRRYKEDTSAATPFQSAIEHTLRSQDPQTLQNNFFFSFE
eukprot:TRINITY_DN218_c0_g3_i1.p1 TRINITY_DN218_c0_g3~~TRINITY_DN218_c0_g3_i1.p1  ORF type:complete len:276 (+),score=41.09 TRINITY_DN218_c0_g3_i1:63-830(+)